MPLVEVSSYRPHPLLPNGHLQSIVPTLFRRVAGVAYVRVRIDTPDGDFLDLDYSRVGSERVAVIAHGLEGSSLRPYVLGHGESLQPSGVGRRGLEFPGLQRRAQPEAPIVPQRRQRRSPSGDKTRALP